MLSVVNLINNKGIYMGIASEEVQMKRGGIIGAFLVAILLSIPLLNMLTGALLVLVLVSNVLTKSSNVGKDMLLLLIYIAAVGLAAFFGLSQMEGKDANYLLMFLPPFLVAFFGYMYLLKNVEAIR